MGIIKFYQKVVAVGGIQGDIIGDTGSIGTAEIAALAVTTAKLAALNVTEAKIALASLTGLVAALVADDNLVGGLPVLHRLDIVDAASGNREITLDHKTRIIDVWVQKTVADGHATEDLITVGAGASAITDDMAIGLLNDTGITRATEINDANAEIAAAGALRVTWVKGSGGGNDVSCTVYVLGIRVA